MSKGARDIRWGSSCPRYYPEFDRRDPCSRNHTLQNKALQDIQSGPNIFKITSIMPKTSGDSSTSIALQVASSNTPVQDTLRATTKFIPIIHPIMPQKCRKRKGYDVKQ